MCKVTTAPMQVDNRTGAGDDMYSATYLISISISIMLTQANTLICGTASVTVSGTDTGLTSLTCTYHLVPPIYHSEDAQPSEDQHNPPSP